jgi:type IV pilus assembly protein PilA
MIIRNNKKGFTIVELAIVIAVIAILAGVLIPTFASLSKKAKEAAALEEVNAAYTVYIADNVLESDESSVDKIHIEHENGVIVTIVNGEIAVGEPDSDSVEYQFGKNSDGDTTLVPATPSSSN